MIVYREIAVPLDNIIYSGNLSAHHKGVMAAINHDIVNVHTLLLQRSKFVSKKTFAVKRRSGWKRICICHILCSSLQIRARGRPKSYTVQPRAWADRRRPKGTRHSRPAIPFRSLVSKAKGAFLLWRLEPLLPARQVASRIARQALGDIAPI